MWPLSMCNPGERVLIRGVAGGLGARRKLEEMGFYPGEEIEVISAQRGGPMIISVKGIRVGIGHGMAHKILVSPNGTGGMR